MKSHEKAPNKDKDEDKDKSADKKRKRSQRCKQCRKKRFPLSL